MENTRNIEAIGSAVNETARLYEEQRASAAAELESVRSEIAEQEKAKNNAAQSGDAAAYAAAEKELSFLAAREKALEKNSVALPYTEKDAHALYMEIDRAVSAAAVPAAKKIIAAVDHIREAEAALDELAHTANMITNLISRGVPYPHNGGHFVSSPHYYDRRDAKSYIDRLYADMQGTVKRWSVSE